MLDKPSPGLARLGLTIDLVLHEVEHIVVVLQPKPNLLLHKVQVEVPRQMGGPSLRSPSVLELEEQKYNMIHIKIEIDIAFQEEWQ